MVNLLSGKVMSIEQHQDLFETQGYHKSLLKRGLGLFKKKKNDVVSTSDAYCPDGIYILVRAELLSFSVLLTVLKVEKMLANEEYTRLPSVKGADQ